MRTVFRSLCRVVPRNGFEGCWSFYCISEKRWLDEYLFYVSFLAQIFLLNHYPQFWWVQFVALKSTFPHLNFSLFNFQIPRLVSARILKALLMLITGSNEYTLGIAVSAVYAIIVESLMAICVYECMFLTSLFNCEVWLQLISHVIIILILLQKIKSALRFTQSLQNWDRRFCFP